MYNLQRVLNIAISRKRSIISLVTIGNFFSLISPIYRIAHARDSFRKVPLKAMENASAPFFNLVRHSPMKLR